MSLLYSDSIVQPIFIEPFLTLHANKLCVLSEHASPNMASWLLKTYEENPSNTIPHNSAYICTSTFPFIREIIIDAIAKYGIIPHATPKIAKTIA